MDKMRRLARRVDQLDLFAEKPSRPRWRKLPAGTKKQLRDLLIQMVVDHLDVGGSDNDGEEVIHER